LTSTAAATPVDPDGVGSPSRPNDVESAGAAAEMRAEAERSVPLVVSAALAVAQPKARRPPAKRVLSSPLRRVQFMVFTPEIVECPGAGQLPVKPRAALGRAEGLN
jgi:hypothetical protein